MTTLKRHTKPAAICWGLALVFAGGGVACGLADPLHSASELGAGLSLLAAGAALTIAFCLLLAGLLVVRQVVVALALVNLVVFIVAAKFLVRGSYIVTEEPIRDFVSSTPWEIVFAILLVSVVISTGLHLLLSKTKHPNLPAE